MRQLLRENFLLTPESYSKVDRPLTESEQSSLVAKNGFKALAIYRFAFTRPNQKNLNGRVYPFAIWDKIIQLSPVTLALMDHPEDGPGSPKDVWAVCRNPAYNEDRTLVTVEAYILDNMWGQSALAVLEAGGEIGLSSSGYGDFMSDGFTVDPEQFELERYFDWVLAPSYEVYGKQADKQYANPAPEKVNGKVPTVPAQVVPTTPEHVVTENNKEIQMTLRETREFEISMKKIFEETSNIEDKKERLEKAKESVSFYTESTPTAYKAEFEKLIEETMLEMENDQYLADLEAAGKQAELNSLKSLVKDIEKEMQEAVSKKDEEIAELKKSLEESEKVIQSFSEDAATKVSYLDYMNLKEYAENAVNLLKEKRAKNEALEAENKKLSENLNLVTRRFNTLTEKLITEEEKAKNHYAEVNEARKAIAHKTAVAKEKELVEKANPQVLAYYEQLFAMGEDVVDHREEMLKKRTLIEAEQYWFKVKRRPIYVQENLKTDLSSPMQVKREKAPQVKSNLNLPKGYL